MQKVLGIALALFLLFPVVGAWAGEIVGKLRKVDPAERTFVLDDGTRLWLAEGLTLNPLNQGATVKATYQERNGKKVVTYVEIVAEE